MSIGGGGNVVGEAVYNMTVDDTDFQRGLRQADSDASQLGGTFNRISSVGIGAFAGIAQSITNMGIGAVTKSFGFLKGAVIGMNSELQTSTLQFETLFGDAARAEEHVASLFEFAKKTPFETGPIIEASRMLQTFGGDALNSEKYLNLLGDASAAASQGFDQVAFWTGRAYSAIQGGQPFGEAAARLQEMALLTPEARKEMEDLQKSGASAEEVFAVLEGSLGRFSGAMEKQAGTWAGLTSTFSDTVNILIATAFRPFFTVLSEGLGAINNFLGSDALASFSEVMGERLASGVQLVTRVLGTFIGILRGPLTSAFTAVRDGVRTFVQAIQGDWVADERITTFHLVIGRIGSAFATIIGPASSVISVFQNLARYFGAVLDDGDYLNDWLTHLPAVIQPVVQAVGLIISNFGDFLTVAAPVLSILRQLFVAFGQGGLQGAIEAFPGIIDNVIGSFRNVGSVLLTVLKTVIPSIVDSIRNVDWGGVATDLYNVARDNLTSIDWGGIATTILGVLAEGFSTVTDLGATLFGIITDQFSSIDWSSVGETITGGIAGAVGAVGGIGATLFSAVWDAVTGVDWPNLGAEIITLITSALGKVGDAGQAILDAIITGIEGVANFGQRVGTWIIDRISEIEFLELGGTILNKILDGIFAIADVATRLATAFADWFGEIEWTAIGTTILNGILGALTAIGDVAVRFGTWLYNAFRNIQWTEIATDIVNKILAALTAIGDFAERLGTWLYNTFTSINWAGIATEIQEGIGTAISSATRIATSISDQIMAFDWSGAGNAITSGIGTGIDWTTAIDFSWLSGIVDPIISALQPILAIIEPMIFIIRQGVESMMTSFSELGKAMGPLIASFNEWGPLLKVVGAIIGGVVVVAIAALVLGITGLAAIIAKTLVVAIKLATGVFETMGGQIKIVSSIIVGVVEVVASIFRGEWSEAWESAKGIVTGVIEGIVIAINGFPAAVLDVINGLVRDIIGYFTDLYNELVGNSIVPDMINGIITAFLRLPGEIISMVSEFVTSVLGFFNDLFTDGVQFAVDLVTDIVAEFTRLFTEGPQWIWDTYLAVIGYLESLVEDGVQEVIDFVKGVIDEVKELPGKALTALGNLKEHLWGAGVDIIAGFLGGIKEKWEDVKGFFADAPGNIKDWVTGGFSIGSPSKMMIPLGSSVIEGFNEGMASEFAATEKIVNDFSNGIIDQFGNLIPGHNAVIKKMWEKLPLQTYQRTDESLQIFKEYMREVARTGNALNSVLEKTIDDTGAEFAAAGNAWLQGNASALNVAEPAASIARETVKASDTVRDAFDGLQAAMDFIAKAVEVKDISFEGINDFIAKLANLSHTALANMGEVAGDLSGDFLSHASTAAGAITSSFGAIGAALDFVDRARETGGIDFSGLAELINELIEMSVFATRGLGDAAAQFSDEFLAQAERLSGAVTSAMGILQQGMDFVVAAREIGENTNFESIQNLASNIKFLVEHVARSIGDSAAVLAETRGADFLRVASEYASNTGSAMDAMMRGVEFAKALQGLTFDLDTVQQAASDLKFLIENIVFSIGDSAALVASTRPDGFLGAADIFAASAETATGALMQGAEFISSIGELMERFDLGAAMEMASSLKFLIEHIVLSIADSAQFIAQARPEGLLDGIQRFVDQVRPAIELLTMAGEFGTFARSLDDYEDGSFLYYIGDLENMARSLVNIASVIASVVSAAATEWSSNAGPSIERFVADVGQAIQLLTDAASFGTMARGLDAHEDGSFLYWVHEMEPLAQSLATIASIVGNAVSDASAEWSSEINPKLAAFATDVGASLGLITGVIDFIGQVGAGGITLGLNAAQDLAETLVGVAKTVAAAATAASETWANEADPKLAAFVADAGAGLGLIRTVIDTISAIRDYAENGGGKSISGMIPAFIDMVETVIEAIRGAADRFEVDGLAEIERFTETAGAGLQLMGNAAEAMSAIVDVGRLTPRAMDQFVDNWDLVLSGVERLSKMIETRGLNVAQKVLDDVEAMAGALTAAMELMHQISGDYLAATGAGGMSGPSIASPSVSSPTASSSGSVVGGTTRAAEGGVILYGDVVTEVRFGDEPVRRIVRSVVNDTVRETI